MINFHPHSNQLDCFVAGNLEPANALIVSAHVDMCSTCQQICRTLQELNSVEALCNTSVTKPDFKQMLATITELPKIDSKNAEALPTHLELDGKRFLLPRTLKRYVKHTGNWSKLVGKLWQAPVDLGCMGKANFIYMEKGGKVPEHTHRGSEFTLVIDGQYSDGISHYDCGDLTLLNGEHTHQPYSDVDDGCLVFTVVDKPLYFTSGIARLLNPFSHLFFK